MATPSPISLKEFRLVREATLRKDWLTVVGLSWLSEGANSIGSKAGSRVPLPKSAPIDLGKIWLNHKDVQIEFEHKQDVLLDGKPVEAHRRYSLKSDKNQEPTMVTLNNVSFFVIDRVNGLGVRVRDTQSDTLKNFKGLSWWSEMPELRITGHWQKLDPPMRLLIPDVTGHSQEELITGRVTFSIQGQSFELYPTRKDNRLFFVFKDETSGKSSYGTGRFLNAEIENDERVILDFNRAYNPPCAYIHFATCPIAPSINRLKVAIEAGEKAPIGH